MLKHERKKANFRDFSKIQLNFVIPRNSQPDVILLIL